VKKSITAALGDGEELFHHAKQLISSGKLTNTLSWCQLIRTDQTAMMQSGDTVSTLIQFYKLPIWTLNPCRVVEVMDYCFNQERSQRVGVKYCTLQGHLLQGEETFQVSLLPPSEPKKKRLVVFEMTTCSKPSGAVSRLCLPLIRTLQDKFLHSHVTAFHNLLHQNPV
jgi:uncharacterized protein (UPF0548 family)